jgi:hypothetical protein
MVDTSTLSKHKLDLTKCEKKKVLKKKKKETSLPRKKICQKELGENIIIKFLLCTFVHVRF